jgi:SAV_6107-like HEPN
MTWNELLANGDAQRHATSRTELENMRALIERDLGDAAVPGLSADRRFATAYNAALQAANMVIACAGYRITARVGHHRISFESAAFTLGATGQAFTDYFDLCRRKRNLIDYTFSHVASETEAEEILTKTREFCDFVEKWIAAKYPKLAK